MYQQQVHLTQICYLWIFDMSLEMCKYCALVHFPVTVSKCETTQNNHHSCYILRPALISYIFWHVLAIWGSNCSTCQIDQLWEQYDNYLFFPLQNKQFLLQLTSTLITGTSFMHYLCYGKVIKWRLAKTYSVHHSSTDF